MSSVFLKNGRSSGPALSLAFNLFMYFLTIAGVKNTGLISDGTVGDRKLRST